ncbi:MAG TPA: zinc-dependent metalloprotease family protein [Polyangiaceae bacterium]|nr:zinc-dependent metalloprotease family protein [Polyangiaceae bacterium]
MIQRRPFLSLLLSAWLPAWAAAADPRRVIFLQPLGKALPEADVALVKAALSVFYDMDVRVAPRLGLPKAAYYSPRRRYRAEKLLSFLEKRAPADAYRVLGITAVDISTTKKPYKDWGVLGLANVDGSSCVMSSFRCKRKAKNAEHARQRFGKVAVHEIGHTFGLSHCPNRGCLMEDAKGSVLTSDREYDLCADCRQKLIRRGYSLASGDPPWPKPSA